MTEQELIEKYGYWGEHPDHVVDDWKYEIENDDTRQSYWQWVESELERDADDED